MNVKLDKLWLQELLAPLFAVISLSSDNGFIFDAICEITIV